MKAEIRVVGIDDSPFDKNKDKFCKVIGTVMRASGQIDGFLCFKVRVDGNDSTSTIIKNIKRSKFHKTLKAIIVDGIALGGFNVIDINKIAKEIGKAVIVIIRKKPNIKEVKDALYKMSKQQNLGEKEFNTRLELIKKAGKIYDIIVKTKKGIEEKRLYFQKSFNISEEDAKKIIKLNIINAFIPETIRISHLIASSLVLGESRKGA